MKQLKRGADDSGLAVVELDPVAFFVRFDCGMVFCQCPFESDKAMQVAVCKVVCNLPDCPVLVRRVELCLGETKDSVSQ